MSQNIPSSASQAVGEREGPHDVRALFPKDDEFLFQDWQKLTQQVGQLDKLSDNLVETGLLNLNESDEIKETLKIARRNLDYTRPYTISVVGASGSGKSTLINALLGRDIVAFKFGFATTGTIITVHQLVAKGDSLPSEEAKVVYYTRQELTEMVEMSCKELPDIEPAYINNDPAQGIDISEMLYKVNNWSPRDLNNDPNNQLFQWDSTSLGVSAPKSQPEPKELKTLKDLLSVAQREEEKLDGPSPSRVVTLDDRGIVELQELMDENAAINKGPQRIIPLIKQIEFTIVSKVQAGRDSLGHVILTDVPGTGANVDLHLKHLLKQLDPIKNDAVILVMASDQRFDTEAGHQLLWLVKDVLMRHKNKEDAQRIFLVVTKGDKGEQTLPEARQKAINEGLRRLANEISDTFSQDYRDHIVPKTIAEPALIAQLIRAHPSAERAWLAGKRPPRFAHLQINPEYYLNKRQEAQAQHRHLGPEEAVLEWSGIPQLRQKLCGFLGDSRWRRDLRTARNNYDEAYSLVMGRIQAQWKDQPISNGKPLEEASQNWKETLAHSQAQHYGQLVKDDAEKVLELFELACNNLRKDEHQRIETTLRNELQVTMAQLKRQIDDQTTSPAAKSSLVEEIPHPYRKFTVIVRASYKQLKALDYQIDQQLDQYAGDIAGKLRKTLQEELASTQVEQRLKELCCNRSHQQYMITYNKKVVGRISRDYKAACRGAILTVKIEHANEMFELLNDPTFSVTFSREFSSGQNGREAESIVNQIRQKYIETCEKLERTLLNLLDQLFFYHLALAEDALRQMIKGEMITVLTQDVADPNSPLHQKYQKNHSANWSKAENMLAAWQQLQHIAS